jgi:hypothetical protein
MANFPAGAIYIWTGTNASIPTGWERVTALDGLYPKGTANSTNPNQTGGAATHTHTGTTHTHADTHTHQVSLEVNAGIGENEEDANCILAHSHAAVTSGACSGGGLSSVSCTYAAFSNDPPYHTVIFIKPTSGTYYFPQNGVYLYDGTDSKTGHYLCNGSNSTPNLVDKYLKGAGTGADAGSTGGSTTNVHSLTHTHTVASHTHGTFNSALPSTTTKKDSWGGSTGAVNKTDHQHSLTPVAATATLTGTPSLTTTETVEPAYTKLLTVQNQNVGVDSYRIGMIGMWVGTLASIPSNYTLCDGTNGTQDLRGKYHKSTATSGDVGDTGGSNTHTHASQNHTHTGVAHTHTHANASHNVAGWYSTDDGPTSDTPYTVTHKDHYHVVTVANSTSTYANAATTGDEQNNEPSYRTVAFIKLNRVGTAAMLLNLI